MMAYTGGRPDRLRVIQQIQQLEETHAESRSHLIVRRLRAAYDDIGERKDNAADVVYEGEGLVRPGSGTVQGYGLGTVENLSLVVLILGVHDIRQGDIVTINDGREYEVSYPPTWQDAFQVLSLNQRSQIGQPT